MANEDEGFNNKPTDSTRWMLEKLTVILQIIVVAAVAWTMNKVDRQTILITEFGTKQVRVMEDVRDNGDKIDGISKVVQKLELNEDFRNGKVKPRVYK